MSGAVWPAHALSMCVRDHVAPVEEVDVRAAGKAHDRDAHGPQQGFDARIEPVRAWQEGRLGANLPAPARSLHELPPDGGASRVKTITRIFYQKPQALSLDFKLKTSLSEFRPVAVS